MGLVPLPFFFLPSECCLGPDLFLWLRKKKREKKRKEKKRKEKKRKENHSTQDSRVVPHRGTNWAAPWLTAQIGRDAVLSESYGRG
jgi:hypothetical protein